MKASLLIKTDCILGEGPMWHDTRKSIWWVDIEDRKIFEYNLSIKNINSWQLEKRVSLILQIENDNHLLIALDDGIASFNIDTGSIKYLLHLEKEILTNRTNDGGCDSNGRLWIGTMDLNCKPGFGSLYCINESLIPEIKIQNTSISNGIVWNLNNTRLYYIDSATYKVDSYFFNVETGHIQFEKTIITVPKELGIPDGMAIDAEGMLWIAQWGGFGIYRWNPVTGKMIDKIYVPAPNVTSCVFGGNNFDTIFITTARQSLSEDELIKYPDSGSIFFVKPAVKGLSANKFKVPAPE